MNKQGLAELIKRLEKATGPDRSIDCLITAALFDPKIMTNPGNHKGEGVEHKPLSAVIAGGFPVSADLASIAGSPTYTASIDAAMTLVPGESYWDLRKVSGAHDATIYPYDGVPAQATSFTDLPALALCIAALKARQAHD